MISNLSDVCLFTPPLHPLNHTTNPIFHPSIVPLPLTLFLFIVVFIVAMLGNSLVIYAVTLSKKTATNILIANHAVAGICMAVMTIPYYHYSVAYSDNWYGGTFLCKFKDFFRNQLVTLIAFTIVALSCYNCREVVSPLGEKPSKKIVVVVCLVLWGVAGALACPFLIYSRQYFDESRWTCHCYFYGLGPYGSYYHGLLLQAFQQYLPVIISVAVLVATTIALRKSGSGGSGGGGEMRRKKTQTKMIAIIAILFAIFHAPWNLSRIFIGIIYQHYESIKVFIHISLLTAICLNPVVYLKMEPDLKGVISGMWARVKGGRRE